VCVCVCVIVGDRSLVKNYKNFKVVKLKRLNITAVLLQNMQHCKVVLFNEATHHKFIGGRLGITPSTIRHIYRQSDIYIYKVIFIICLYTVEWKD
jgi:hypothetical protein